MVATLPGQNHKRKIKYQLSIHILQEGDHLFYAGTILIETFIFQLQLIMVLIYLSSLWELVDKSDAAFSQDA